MARPSLVPIANDRDIGIQHAEDTIRIVPANIKTGAPLYDSPFKPNLADCIERQIDWQQQKANRSRPWP